MFRELVKTEGQAVMDGLGLGKRTGKEVLMGVEGISGGRRSVAG